MKIERDDKYIDDQVVIHYAEIGLKKKNRFLFENRLVANMKKKLGEGVALIRKEPGQVAVELTGKLEKERVEDILKKIPGISHFSFSRGVNLELDKLKDTVLDFLNGKTFQTFKIDTRRRDKNFPLNSMELNAMLGELVCTKLGKRVDLESPDITVKVEITRKRAYFSSADIPGVGGLPTESRQKVVALLSGGIDSPVASFMMMKRGCRVILVHFQNQQLLTQSVEDKVLRLAEQLSSYQNDTRLYVVPFEPIQKEIIMKVHSSHRMLIYKRFMIRIAEKIAEKNRARFLVTGDNMSQVASQTYNNLSATYKVANKHILAPLIGLDKKEITDIAVRIGTYSISILPYGDCCTYFLPRHPVLNATARDLEAMEKNFDIPALIEGTLSETKIHSWP